MDSLNNFTSEQKEVLTEMRKYLKVLNEQLEKTDRRVLEQHYPVYLQGQFPKAHKTNEDLLNWYKSQVINDEYRYIASGSSKRISMTHRHNGYKTVAAAFMFMLMQGKDLKEVKRNYDNSSNSYYIDIKSKYVNMRIVYNGNLTGFQFIEVEVRG